MKDTISPIDIIIGIANDELLSAKYVATPKPALPARTNAKSIKWLKGARSASLNEFASPVLTPK